MYIEVELINTKTCIELEKLFVSLGDQTRLRLISLMDKGPVSVGHLVEALGESQPKISRHLAYLRNAGLVDTNRDGKRVYYKLTEPANDAIRGVLASILSGMDSDGRAWSQARISSTLDDKAVDVYVEPDMYEEGSAGAYGRRQRSEELEIHLL